MDYSPDRALRFEDLRIMIENFPNLLMNVNGTYCIVREIDD